MNCTLYKNSGFNLTNIPDSPSLVRNQNNFIQTSTIDCLQNRFLSSVSIKNTWNAIRDVDYCIIDNFYYFVNSITMTSYDVARLDLTPDFITSAVSYLGLSNVGGLSILDGVTERHHIPKSDDAFGAYDEADPMLSPSRILRLAIDDMHFDEGGSNQYYLVESSIDLYQMATQKPAKTFTDPSNQLEITVPSVVPVSGNTEFVLGGKSTFTSGTQLFDITNASVKNGLQAARDLGVESSVIAQYTIPQTMATCVIDSTTGAVSKVLSSSQVSPLSDSDFNFVYAGVRNMRVLYGENNKYGLVSASGNSSEFNPEEIYNNTTTPSLIMQCDGRYNGSPFFSYDFYHGAKTIANTVTFFTNAVQGQEWRNLPLTYITKSGSVQDAYHLESQRRSEVSALEYKKTQSYLDTAAGAFGSGVKGGILNAVGFGVQGAKLEYEREQTIDQYKIAVEREMYDFGVSQSVVSPTIMFPFQTPTIRDYAGNGVVPYRYYLDLEDRTRIDKILTAYGYRHTALLESSFFTNRPHFNFVKANNVTIGNELPNWWKTGISSQFSAGVRIWHVSPSPIYYERNQ